MKNSLFNKVIIVCLVSALIYSTSCKKQETVKLPEPTQQAQQNLDKGLWVPIIAGVVYVIVHVVEGQYYKEVTYNQNGTIASSSEGCKGWGSCSVRGERQNASGELTSISSVVYGEDYDYSGKAQLIKTKDGKYLLNIPNEPDNEICFKNFFYDDVIEISRPWIIDDPEVLKELGCRDKAITVHGKYQVYTLEDEKYIIIG